MEFVKALTAKEMQLLDIWAVKKAGIPSVVLMENAGRAVCTQAVRRLKENKRKAPALVFKS